MARFGRKETFIASHFTHGFPQSPVSFHTVQPLTWGPYMAYGDSGYGRGLTDFIAQIAPAAIGGRKSIEDLRLTGANTAVYAAYDNFVDLDSFVTQKVGAGRNYTKNMVDIRMISTWPDMSTVAASNSGAKIKTAYLIWLAGKVGNDERLIEKAKQLAENGKSAGEAPGSGSLTSDIKSIYAEAVELVSTSPSASANNQVKSYILPALIKGTGQSAVDKRRKDYEKQQESVRANVPKDEGGEKKSWWDEMGDAAKYTLYGVGTLTVLGTAFWAYGKFSQARKANPKSRPSRRPRLIGNPSAPGVMDGGPELEIANLPAAKKQEKNLANTTFRRGSK